MTSIAETQGLRFCAALDRDDWRSVTALLAADCEYLFRGNTTTGAETIVGSYRSIGEWVRRTFDAVRYESRVEVEADGQTLVSFRDLIDHGDQHLDFRCQQRLTFDRDGRIVRITHIDIEGEPGKVERFNEACGVTKPSA